jgi:osmotically inducible protein OsmC
MELRGTVPGIFAEQLQSLAEAARATCPVSRVLNAQITLDAQLAS